MRNLFVWVLLIAGMGKTTAQRLPDHVYMPEIRTPRLFQQNNQQSMALITLNSSDLLELHFDDMSGVPKNYYYTFVLCNADWTPADVSPFDYIRGFPQNRLSQYRASTVTASRYVHYQALLPDRNCMPSKSGNYLLKVYLDADTSKLAFTKRMLVVDNRASVGAQVQQPFDNEILRTHQKIQVAVNTQQLNILSPQQTKLVILQNNRWDDAIRDIQPTFIRGKMMEYNAEQDCIFPAGKEYRWADLQSFRFLSDRMDRVDKAREPVDVYLKPDLERNNLRYLFFRDRNGWDEINTTESLNPWWQTDYAYVHFTFAPANRQPFAGRSVYLLGSFTGNQIGDTSRMVYDAARGLYTKTILLKQGYYSYAYVTKSDKHPEEKADPALTEGNYWETENEYTVLFYYRSFSSRHDELVGIRSVNSRNERQNF
ncbi:MAG: DUF5103 domain-containing protein [Chitinophagaceae bacterium]|nr:DUF5103 domain-containing protein [Chitinophagaceae bacterium]MCA6452810.1 DUF5103 domain-containing protein [Chitinophagaceae bacterium]MCA6456726.1 DUF5103 domain-containing protein [Chitinophagaceae bacterium]MCA6459488.1 DUF5103 domain-containing protein [Chitinophagaceae bacterium]MCA6464708.1 DUF5103 domain-containing protein [Chitinophagaceae bacterium]